MPKSILEFNLPEESEDFKLAREGASLRFACDEFDNWLRSALKYEVSLMEDKTMHSNRELEVIETIRRKFNELTNDLE